MWLYKYTLLFNWITGANATNEGVKNEVLKPGKRIAGFNVSNLYVCKFWL
jgi:hypothetical protein